MKGIALAGVVSELAAAGWTFPRVAGTSAGAIAAALVAVLGAAGKPLSQITDVLRTVDYKQFVRRGPMWKVFGRNDLARELGGALGIAVLGSIVQSTYRSNLDLTGLSDPVAQQARSSLALASRLGPAVTDHAQVAFADGMQSALLYAAGTVAVAVAVLLGRHTGTDETSAEPATSQPTGFALELPPERERDSTVSGAAVTLTSAYQGAPCWRAARGRRRPPAHGRAWRQAVRSA